MQIGIWRSVGLVGLGSVVGILGGVLITTAVLLSGVGSKSLSQGVRCGYRCTGRPAHSYPPLYEAAALCMYTCEDIEICTYTHVSSYLNVVN